MLDQSWFDDWREMRSETKRIAEMVPDDRLDYKPHLDLMPMGELSRHIVGACYFILMRGLGRKVTMPDPIRNKVPMPGKVLRQELEETSRLVESVLSDFTEEDLATLNKQNKTMRETLRHLMEHEIHHRAQLKLYLKTLGLKTQPEAE